MRETLIQWTLLKLEDDPRRFGSDNGNAAIILEYLITASQDDRITLITLETISNAVTVSRIKNAILLERPDLDFRDKNSPKPRSKHHEGQMTIFDFIDETERKIIDYLSADQTRWSLSPSRICKSVRGADIDTVKCILRHPKLYDGRHEKALNDGSLTGNGETKRASNVKGEG
jgi:hypothetical protein